MRNWSLTLGVVVVAVAAAPAQDNAAATIKRAIEAHGGEELLAKYKAGQYDLAGKMALPTGEVDYTSTVTYEAPDKYALTLVMQLGAQKVTLGQVVNGDKTRVTVDGRAQKVSPAQEAEAKSAASMQEITQLTPLLDAARYTLKTLPETKFRGEPAAAVSVTPAKGKEVTLFFSQKTGQLAGTRRQGLDPAEKPVSEETVLNEYQKVQNVFVPMGVEVTHDGKKFTTMKLSKVKLLESADPNLFKAE